MKFNKSVKLLASIVMCEMAGIIGSVFTAPAIGGWYKALEKPAFSPPNWIFGPVWTTLFVLMGISFYILWEKGRETKKARIIFGIQLFFNIAWSFLFFYLQSPMLAFFGLLVLWLAILWTMKEFSKFSWLAVYLLVPYILWVSFAGVLNFFIWILN